MTFPVVNVLSFYVTFPLTSLFNTICSDFVVTKQLVAFYDIKPAIFQTFFFYKSRNEIKWKAAFFFFFKRSVTIIVELLNRNYKNK